MEYKFRAWDKINKKMDYSPINSIGFDGKVYYGNADMTGSEFYSDIMQCVGLRDKTRKEIYEGDIVYWHSTRSNRYCGRYKIIWQPKKCGFGMELIGSYPKIYGMQAGKQLEIIGDIYENPELLERV